MSRSYARTSSGLATPGGIAAVALIGLVAFHWPKCYRFGPPSHTAEPTVAAGSGATPASGTMTSALPRDEPPPPARISPGGGSGSSVPPSAPRRRLADDVVIRALDRLQPAFLRCYQRAQRNDPSLGKLKVTVHLELDAGGVVTLVQNDATDAALATCVSAVAKKLPLPVPGEPVFADIPLFFQ